jgi:hypothetical protein
MTHTPRKKFEPFTMFEKANFSDDARAYVKWCFKQEQILKEEIRKQDIDARKAARQENVKKVLEQFNEQDKKIREREEKQGKENLMRKIFARNKGRK